MASPIVKGIKKPENDIKILISEFKIEHLINQKIEFLSPINKKIVSLTSCLIGDPTVLFLDEPCKGIELKNRAKIWTLIRSFRKFSRLVIISCHNVEEAKEISDDIIVMHMGSIDVRGEVEEIKRYYGMGYKFEI